MCIKCAFSRRAAMSGAAAMLVTSFLNPIAQAQRRLIIRGSTCNMLAALTPREVVGFELSAEARGVVVEICDAIGLPQNFKIFSVNDPEVNAYAVIADGERQIVYDETFMKSIANKRSRDWSGLTVVAHEIGHHLSGHTLDNIGSRPPRELEADHFAGLVIRLLGGGLRDATKVFEGMSATGSMTHPPRAERIAVVTAGWKKADSKMQSAEERHNLMTHDQVNGKIVRVISEFVGRDKNWVEYHASDIAASFREMTRDARSIFLYDKGRSIWVKIDVDKRGGFSIGYFARGPASPMPSNWTPLDPTKWKA